MGAKAVKEVWKSIPIALKIVHQRLKMLQTFVLEFSAPVDVAQSCRYPADVCFQYSCRSSVGDQIAAWVWNVTVPTALILVPC